MFKTCLSIFSHFEHILESTVYGTDEIPLQKCNICSIMIRVISVVRLSACGVFIVLSSELLLPMPNQLHSAIRYQSEPHISIIYCLLQGRVNFNYIKLKSIAQNFGRTKHCWRNSVGTPLVLGTILMVL